MAQYLEYSWDLLYVDYEMTCVLFLMLEYLNMKEDSNDIFIWL
jgi:hypothetical protein